MQTKLQNFRAKPKIDNAQRKRFIDAAREHGASEEEAVFDANLRRIITAKTDAEKIKKR